MVGCFTVLGSWSFWSWEYHPIGLDLLAPTTVGHPPSPPWHLLFSLDPALGLFLLSSLASGYITCLAPLLCLWLLPLLSAPPAGSPGFRAICMNEDLATILEHRIESLVARIEVLELEVKSLKKERAAPSSVGSYSFLPAASAPSSVAGDSQSSVSNDYNRLAETIPPVPEEVIRACSLLTGGGIAFRERASRAWEAGHWARFCLEGQLSKPRPTQPISLANQYYVVLRAEGFSCPLLCDKAADYRYVVQDFKKGTISHGFPSKCEAWTYAKAAGYPLPAQPYRWSPST